MTLVVGVRASGRELTTSEHRIRYVKGRRTSTLAFIGSRGRCVTFPSATEVCLIHCLFGSYAVTHIVSHFGLPANELARVMMVLTFLRAP